MTEADIDRELDEEEEEVTAVTLLFEQLRDAAKECKASAEKVAQKALEVQEIARESQEEVKP